LEKSFFLLEISGKGVIAVQINKINRMIELQKKVSQQMEKWPPEGIPG